MTIKRLPLFLFVLFISLSHLEAATSAKPDNGTQLLKSGWAVRSSADVSAPGEKISTAGFDRAGWYPTTVPSTVLAALVKNGIYRDVYFGRNLESISYEPFRVSWWYRNEFNLEPGSAPAQSVRLIFDGINYSANIFLNGTQVASADSVSGAFRRFDLDVSRLVRKKGNVLAVQVFPPKPGDFTIGFVDWNPISPDRNMGLWREVKLRKSGPVTIENPFVQSKLDLESFQEARLTVIGMLVNHTDRPVSGNVNGEIDGGIKFKQEYSLAPKESKEVRFDPSKYSELIVQKPRVWWPNNLGSPELYTLKLTVGDRRGISDRQNITFGIREVADYLTKEDYRGYIVNGKKVLIRGGGWVDDLLLNEDPKNLEAQFQYVKHLNLNTVRLEGFWGSSEKLYDLADRYGILVMAGFSCQWEWKGYLEKDVDEEFGGVMSKEDMDLTTQYLRDQVLWLRNHPSIFVWALASDLLPNPELEKRYRAELERIDPTRPSLSSTKGFTSKITGPTGVKMNGPYEYVTPNYWYVDKENGGAFGFNTETGPGAQPPPAESIRNMFAKEHHWPVNEMWDFHSGRNEFNTMSKYMNAFNKRYGEAEDLDDFSKRAQAANYEAIRAMFEAFGVRKPKATGIVQWMLNAAWPKMFWQLYDYYLMPGGAFYGTRKANQPLNIAYDYSDRSIHLVNDTYDAHSNLNAEIKIVSIDSKQLLSKIVKVSVGENESKKIFQIPDSVNEVPVNFMSLKLKDSGGKDLADNFYWLSAKPDVLDFKGGDWYFTPNKEYADFSSLKNLKPAQLQVEQNWTDNRVTLNLKNPSPNVAFFVELKVVADKTGRTILPVFWNDNYISLLPGESKQLTARFSPEDFQGERPALQYSGWNVGEVRSAAFSSEKQAADKGEPGGKE